jgi:hypothetical protein
MGDHTHHPDPEYLAFLEQLHAPQQPLPSAEVQLERREAEEKAALGTQPPYPRRIPLSNLRASSLARAF